MENVHSLLSPWETFYVILGSSGAALTGLQFVVITLISGTKKESGPSEVAAFGTPTVVHFCAVLVVAEILSAPWRALWGVGLVLALCGLAGVLYSLIVTARARRSKGYKPVLEDWLWHSILPLFAYAMLFAAAAGLLVSPTGALFVIAATALLLLFVGIHNAWDAVTYIALDRS